MKFGIHPIDLKDLITLSEEKDRVCCNVDSGSLKKRDVEILWSKAKELITVKGKDIKP